LRKGEASFTVWLFKGPLMWDNDRRTPTPTDEVGSPLKTFFGKSSPYVEVVKWL